jgi:non-specific protein-tyrosine kinase
MESTAADRSYDLRDYVALLRRRKAIVTVVTVLTVVAAVTLSFVQQTIYRSTAKVLLQPRASEQIFSPDQQLQTAQQQTRVQTEIQVMRSLSVEDAVTKALGHRPAVSIAANGLTDVVSISAESHDPQEAADIANTYARTYVRVRRESTVNDLLDAAAQIQQKITKIDGDISALQKPLDDIDTQILAADNAALRQRLKDQRDALVTQSAQQRSALDSRRSAFSVQLDRLQLAGNLTQTGGAQIVSDAQPSSAPVKPKPKRDAVLAVLVGLLLGVGLAFLRDYLDDTIKSKEDVDLGDSALGVLGLVPRVDTWKDRSHPTVISVTAPASAAAEAYRALRTAVQFMGIERTVQVIQVTSPAAAEGKSTTLANLGVVLARAGKRVVLVDCDLRKPRIESFFGVENHVGITSVLVGDCTLAGALHCIPGEPRLAVLPAGPPLPNPSELLSAKQTADIIAALRTEADYVLVDCPPLLPVADSVIIAGMVDATLLVAAARSTTKRDLHRAVELLQQVDAPLIGAVLNGVGLVDSYGYGSGYSYTYGANNGRRGRRPWKRRQDSDRQGPHMSEPADSGRSYAERVPRRQLSRSESMASRLSSGFLRILTQYARAARRVAGGS